MTTGKGAKTVRPDVPEVPANYRRCFEDFVRLPKPGPKGYTAAQLYAIAMDLRHNELVTKKCGRDAIAWMDQALAIVRGN